MPADRSAVDGLLEALSADFIARHPTEAARTLEEVEVTSEVALLEDGSGQIAAGLLERTAPDRAVDLIRALSPNALASIAVHLDLQMLAGLLARMEPEDRETQLQGFDKAIAGELRELLTYPVGSAGALMHPRTVVFREEETADKALSRLRSLGREIGADVQVVDAEGRLRGRLSIQRLITAEPDARVGDLAKPPIYVYATASLDEVLEAGQGTSAGVGVVDVDGRLLGVIRRNRMTSAAEQEASADLQTMVGVSKEERALSPASFAIRKRLPWLYINLLTAFLAASVVGIFEGTIAQVTALAVLLPVVAGQAGNSGSQALAVSLRGLALREVRIAQWRRLGSKELAVGFVNGLAIAAVTGVGVTIWSGSSGLGMVIAAAMVVSMTLAGMAGAAIPLALKAFGQDPAQSSSIFLTTVTDVVGFASFLGFATIFASII